MPHIWIGPRGSTSTATGAYDPIAVNFTEQNLTANVSLTDTNTSYVLLTPDASTWFVNVASRTKAIYIRNESSTYDFTVIGGASNVVMSPSLGIQFLIRPSDGKAIY